MKWIDIKQGLYMQPECARRMVYKTANGKLMILSYLPTQWHIDKYALTHWIMLPDGDDSGDLLTLLGEANDLLRSCNAVCERRGVSTNWEALKEKIGRALKRQHAAIYPEYE